MNNKKALMIAGILVIGLFIFGSYVFVKGKLNKGTTATVEIKCETSNEVGELKEYQSFSCSVAGTKYTFTVQSIKDNKMKIKVDKYGLTQVKSNGTISLTEQVDVFEIEKGDTLKLAPQVTDGTSKLELTWKK